MSNAVREKIEAYFASLNSTSNRMMADIISSREKYLDKWENMDPDEQSDILWKSIVKPDVIVKYNNLPSKILDVEYFPVLRTKPGEKIIVEEDTASAKSFVSGSAYHDEHSAPFRWETQSQIDFRLQDSDTEKESIKTLERSVPKQPELSKPIPESPKVVHNPPKSPKPEKNVLKSPKLEGNVLKSPIPTRSIVASPQPEDNVLKSPKTERNVMKSPKPVRNPIKSLTLDPKLLKSTKLSTTSLKSPKPDLNVIKSPKIEVLPNSPRLESNSLVSPKPDADLTKSPRLDRHALKKDDEIKRSTIKRPEVPPPPVPPHHSPPVPPHVEAPVPPVPSHSVKKTEKETPIYAKVVKRKSANAKTLMISEMNIHRRAKEEMKPAVPPRMSLELKKDMDLMKYTAHTIDIDGIPKTGFDFLDNW